MAKVEKEAESKRPRRFISNDPQRFIPNDPQRDIPGERCAEDAANGEAGVAASGEAEPSAGGSEIAVEKGFEGKSASCMVCAEADSAMRAGRLDAHGAFHTVSVRLGELRSAIVAAQEHAEGELAGFFEHLRAIL